MKKILLLVILLMSIQVYSGDFNKSDVKKLKKIIKHNYKAMNDKDIDEYMKDIHPKSPGFQNTKLILSKMFSLYDIKTTYIDMKPLMIDEQYFIIRTKQKTIEKSGKAPFPDSVTDAIHVYKKYKGNWKLWSSMILEVNPIKKSPKKK